MVKVHSARIAKSYTVAQYLVAEEKSVSKHEFFNGKIIKMPGASHQHNQIAANIITGLNLALDDVAENFIVYSSDMKIHIPRFNHFVYPDAVVICEEPVLYAGRTDTILNPVLVVEVLSPSTSGHDRGNKFLQYQTLPSFKEYLLVAQDQIEVTRFFCGDGHNWEKSVLSNLDTVVELKSLNVQLPLKRIYNRVKLG
jgi:Uma2 family endonuclease